MKLKYIVKLDYKYFEFDDRFEALDFAGMAALKTMDATVKIEIEVKREGGENE